MGLFGSIIGGIGSAIGGIFGSDAVNEGYNQAIEAYEKRIKDVKDHRDKVYYQDPTQSAAAQGAQTKAKEILDAKTKQAADTNVVAGGTDESLALQKQAAAQAVTDMIGKQAASGEAQKEAAWNNADNQISEMTQYIASTKLGKAQEKGKAITDAAGGLSNMANLLPF